MKLLRLLRYLFNERGDVGSEGGGGNADLDWRGHIPEDVKGDPELAPVIEKITEKDIPSLVKSHIHLTRKMGRSVTLPGKDAKPEELAALRGRLAEAGVMQLPPDSPDKYELTKPENLAEGLSWNDELAGNFKQFAAKIGLTQQQAQDLVGFHAETIAAMQGPLMQEHEKGMAKLKETWGEKFTANQELAGRAWKSVFQNDPEALAYIEKTGMGNHPAFINVMAKLGSAMQEHEGGIPPGGGDATLDAEEKAVMDIINNPENPDHKKWHQGDKNIQARITAFFDKKYGTKPANQPTGQSTPLVGAGS